jgi:hypothetical protein
MTAGRSRTLSSIICILDQTSLVNQGLVLFFPGEPLLVAIFDTSWWDNRLIISRGVNLAALTSRCRCSSTFSSLMPNIIALTRRNTSYPYTHLATQNGGNMLTRHCRREASPILP